MGPNRLPTLILGSLKLFKFLFLSLIDHLGKAAFQKPEITQWFHRFTNW